MPKYNAEKRRSIVADAIRSLPTRESRALSSLDPERSFYRQARPCDFCGEIFTPTTGLARFCGPRCNTKFNMRIPEVKARIFNAAHAKNSGAGHKRWLAGGSPGALLQIERVRALNPTKDPAVREKISARLREMGHQPKLRGGNGRPMPIPQRILSRALGPEWQAEYVLPTRRPGCGLPNHYKIDLALPHQKIAIEVDGPSHYAAARQEQDRRKTEFLCSCGWTVLRFWNKDILSWKDSGQPTDHFISMTLRSHGIPLSVSTGY